MNIANERLFLLKAAWIYNLSPHKDVEYVDCVQQYFQREK